MRVLFFLFVISMVACSPTAEKVDGKYVQHITQNEVVMDDGTTLQLPSGKETKVIYLVRHAEKDTLPPKNPILTDQGYRRAHALAQIFKSTKLDAVYSTLYNRTMHTVDSLTTMKGLSTSVYQPKDLKRLSDTFLTSNDLNRILVCGHSNTTPGLAGALMGEKMYESGFDESDYSNLLVFTVDEDGQKALHRLRYFATAKK